MGFSNKHASTVPLVLNPTTGSITAQWNVVFDNWFATVASDPKDFPDFDSPEWRDMFKDSTFILPYDDDDWRDMEKNERAAIKQERVASRFDAALPPMPLLPAHDVVTTPWTDPNPMELAQQRENSTTIPSVQPQQREQLEQREQPPIVATPAPPAVTPPTASSSDQTPASPAPRSPPVASAPAAAPPLAPSTSWTTVERRSRPTTSLLPTRKSRRIAKEQPEFEMMPDAYWEKAAHRANFSSIAYYSSAKARNPNLFTWWQVIKDTEHLDKWLKAAEVEIKALEDKEVWDEIPKSKARGQIVPLMWVFWIKRSPDGEIKKFKPKFANVVTSKTSLKIRIVLPSPGLLFDCS